MAQIGHFLRIEAGYQGHIHTALLDADLVFVPAGRSDAENAPDYRIHLDDEHGPEIGAGWKQSGERAGPFVSVLIDDPALTQPIRARLFQADADGPRWALHWTRQKKRAEQD